MKKQIQIKLHGWTFDLPDVMRIYSFEQFDFAMNSIQTILKAPILKSEKDEQLKKMFPLFCAYYLQPLKDGKFEVERVFQVQEELVALNDREDIDSVGIYFIFVAKDYYDQIQRARGIEPDKHLIDFIIDNINLN